MCVMYKALFETPHWTFEAFGNSELTARCLLIQAWRKHARETGANEYYILEFDTDIVITEIYPDVVYRDGELFYTRNEGK
jgi:hypothetical protein